MEGGGWWGKISTIFTSELFPLHYDTPEPTGRVGLESGNKEVQERKDEDPDYRYY